MKVHFKLETTKRKIFRFEKNITGSKYLYQRKNPSQ